MKVDWVALPAQKADFESVEVKRPREESGVSDELYVKIKKRFSSYSGVNNRFELWPQVQTPELTYIIGPLEYEGTKEEFVSALKREEVDFNRYGNDSEDDERYEANMEEFAQLSKVLKKGLEAVASVWPILPAYIHSAFSVYSVATEEDLRKYPIYMGLGWDKPDIPFSIPYVVCYVVQLQPSESSASYIPQRTLTSVVVYVGVGDAAENVEKLVEEKLAPRLKEAGMPPALPRTEGLETYYIYPLTKPYLQNEDEIFDWSNRAGGRVRRQNPDSIYRSNFLSIVNQGGGKINLTLSNKLYATASEEADD